MILHPQEKGEIAGSSEVTLGQGRIALPIPGQSLALREEFQLGEEVVAEGVKASNGLGASAVRFSAWRVKMSMPQEWSSWWSDATRR